MEKKMENKEIPTNSNLISCKSCGQMIAKSAKKCPNCGEKNKKPIYKRVWFIILCIIVLLGIAGSIAGGGDDTSTTIDADKAAVETEATEATTEAIDPTADMTTAQKNAYKAGLNYLDFMPFSKQGLIDQLSSDYGDGYEVTDAEVAVNAIEESGQVDWVEQAKKAAQNYLDMMSFSKDGLIEQLESSAGDQYTHEQAVEAVEAVYK